ncbi:hypothetical protein pb186bvf_008503 [Paramecium bursaria]
MQQSNFEQDLIESEQAFAEQFDPNSVTYHGGIKVPVPVGGARVPESMPTMYPEQQDLNQYLNKEETDYGPEYRRCMYLKEFLADLKKTLNKISATHEALLRNQELQFKVDKNNAQAVEKLENNKQNELAGLNNTLELLKTQITYLDKDEKLKDRYKELVAVHQLSQKSYNSKEELFEFYQLIKNLTSAIFKDNQRLTDEIKQIKKLYTQK